jgi:replication factor A1
MIRVKISEIKPGMRGLVVGGKVTLIGDIKSVETRFGPARVAQAVLEDETGRIILNLWRNQIDIVRTGDTVIVENAFVKVFGNQLELNVGRDGRITVIRRVRR